MRIAMVTPWFPSDVAPESGVFVLRDALALMDAGHGVSVLHLDSSGTVPHGRDLGRDDLPVWRVGFRRTDPRSWHLARREVRRLAGDADLVHTHALSGLLPFAFRRPAGRKPWVHTEHWSGITAPETLTPRGRLARRAMLPLLSSPDVVVTQCERLAAAVRPHRHGGALHNVPCIVKPPVKVVEPPREQRPLRLIGIGGLVPRKGPLVALEAVRVLRERGIDAVLTWVGDGPQRDEMKTAANRWRLGDRLHLTGTLREAEVRAALDAHDIFILPTLGDNFCIVAAEALSHGRPIVSGAATGAVDYSDPAVSEFVGEHQAAVYADAVERLISRTSAMTAVEIADTVRDRFTPRRVSALLEEAFRAAGA